MSFTGTTGYDSAIIAPKMEAYHVTCTMTSVTACIAAVSQLPNDWKPWCLLETWRLFVHVVKIPCRLLETRHLFVTRRLLEVLRYRAHRSFVVFSHF